MQIEERVAAVGALSPTDLRSAWRLEYGSDPPAVPSSLLARKLTYDMQRRAMGGAARRIERQLDKAGESDGRLSKQGVKTQLRPGAQILREWGERTHRVDVRDDGGFVYEGRAYSSLSKIARIITGARWSGPRFFGVRG